MYVAAFEHDPHHSDASIGLQGVSQRGFRRGVNIAKRASQGGTPVQIEKKGKALWRGVACTGSLTGA